MRSPLAASCAASPCEQTKTLQSLGSGGAQSRREFLVFLSGASSRVAADDLALRSQSSLGELFAKRHLAPGALPQLALQEPPTWMDGKITSLVVSLARSSVRMLGDQMISAELEEQSDSTAPVLTEDRQSPLAQKVWQVASIASHVL